MEIKNQLEQLYIQRNSLYLRIDSLQKTLNQICELNVKPLLLNALHIQFEILDTYLEIKKLNKSIFQLESKLK